MLTLLFSILIPTTFGAPPCDHARYDVAQGFDEALNLCLASDLFDLSFDFVYDAATDHVAEHKYTNKYCDGEGEYNRGAAPNSVVTGTGRTCPTFGAICKRTISTKTGQLMKDNFGFYEEQKGRTFGQNNNPNKGGDWTYFVSITYGDCIEFWPGKVWYIVEGCDQKENGEDVLYWQWYSDAGCTAGQELAPDTYHVTRVSQRYKTLSAKYTREQHEGVPFYSVQIGSNEHTYDTIAQDIMCYDAAEVDPKYEESGGWWTTLEGPMMLNVLVSAMTTVCIICTCFGVYQWFKSMGFGANHVHWQKVPTEV